ncbi:MAG: CHAT domain-containing protein, partial [Bacteroidetes bacterium]
YYEAAADIFETRRLTIDLYVGRYVFQELGNIYTRQGDYKAAEIFLRKFKNIALEYDDVHAAAEALNDLGIVYEHTARDSLAIEAYLSGLGLSENALASRALPEGNLAQVYFRKGALDKALFWARKARDSFGRVVRENGHPEAPARLSNIHLLIAGILAQKNETPAAEVHFRKALGLFRQYFGADTLRREFGKIHLAFGSFLVETKRPERALTHFQIALKTVLPDFRPGGIFDNPDPSAFYPENVIMDGLAGKADAFYRRFEATGDPDFLRQSVACHRLLFEAERACWSVHRFQASKLQIIGERYERTEQAIRAALRLYECTGEAWARETAFVFAEKSKSVLLFQALRHSDARAVADVPDDILNAEKALNEHIADLDKQRFRLEEAGAPEAALDSLESAQFKARRAAADLVRRIEQSFPAYFRLKYGRDDPGVTEIQSALDPDEALVEYFLGKNETFVFLIKKDRFEVITLSGQSDIAECVRRFRENIEAFQFEQTTALCEAYTSDGLRLYEALFRPLEAFGLPPRLVVVPSGALAFLPFEALLRRPPAESCAFKSYDYLLRHFEVVYNYSANMWLELKNRPRSRASHTFLGFAPDFSDPNENCFPPLQYSIPTLEALSSRLDGAFLIGPAATRRQFEQLAEHYQILHFSTHASANARESDFSFIALEGCDSLFVKDIYPRHLRADMVFLGACETGFGRLYAGEGVISLARSFLYAGANSVFTTLWSVNDKMTETLTLRFYENLQKGDTKSAALRAAKLAQLDDPGLHPNFAHPVYWAAWTPVGNMAPLWRRHGVWRGVLGGIFLMAAGWGVWAKFRSKNEDSYAETV